MGFAPIQGAATGGGSVSVNVGDVVGLSDALLAKADVEAVEAVAIKAAGPSDTSTNAYETILDIEEPEEGGGGLYMLGSIRNNGSGIITIKETVNGPAFEAPEVVEHDLAVGEVLLLDTLFGAVGENGVPPYATYTLEVKSKVADTPGDYVLRTHVIGTVND
jgi:hypothetical protein